MERIKISREAKCAQEKFCFPAHGKKESKQKWIDGHDLFTDSNGRAFALVDSEDRVYFMDAVTGSLYQFGNCLTSDILKSGGMTRNKKAAQEFLMGLRTDDDKVPDVAEPEAA